MTEFLAITVLSLLGGVIALAGGIIFLYVRSWSATLSNYSVPFAAGVLITVSLIGLLPEAIDAIGEGAFTVALLAFFGSYLFEHVAFDLHHHEVCHHKTECYQSAIWLVIVGDTIHNFVDGVTIAAAYMISPGLAVITTISTFLHEVPHEIGDFGILLKAGWERKNIILVNVFSALASVLGAWMVLFITDDEQVIGYLLAVAAGIFLYLGAGDFLPHADEELSTKKTALAMFVGVFIMMITINSIPHSHDHNDADSHEQEAVEQSYDNQ